MARLESDRDWPRGRCVLITGAAGGIGSSLARRFGRAGARLALLDLAGAPTEQLAAELAEAAIEALPIDCDVTCLDSCRQAALMLVARWGGIDVLVANAGITHLSPFAATEVDVIRRVMEVNFFGAVNITKACLDSLSARRGRIVVLSSIAGVAPLAARTGYAASKHALHGFFDSLRAELVPTGVGVTLVCPSFVRTSIGDAALGGDGGAPKVERVEATVPVSPDATADAIFDAVERQQRLLFPSRSARLARFVSRWSPRFYQQLMLRRTVPAPADRVCSGE